MAWLPAQRRTRSQDGARHLVGTLLSLVVLLAALTGVAAGGAGTDPQLQAIAGPARGGIVLLSACRETAATQACRWSTAWSPAPGYFVTAAHVLADGGVPRLSVRGAAPVAATVVAEDSAHDLVLLRAPLSIPVLPRASVVGYGQQLVAVCSRRAVGYQGHPGATAVYGGRLGGPPIHEVGGDDIDTERLAGAASVLGCSGAPVLDGAGRVTGVAIVGDGANAGMVPVSVAVGLLARAARETV